MDHAFLVSRFALVHGSLVCAFLVAGCGDADPATTLVRVTPEPVGVHCSNGGVILEQGLDSDHDGVLGDDEVDTTEYVCSGEIGVLRPDLCGDAIAHSTVVIEGASDFAALEGIACVNGSVLVVGTSLGDLRGMASLRQIAGDLVIAANDQLTRLDGLDGLALVNGNLILNSNEVLEDLRPLGKLEGVFGAFQLRNHRALVDLDGLDALGEVRGGLEVVANPALVDIDGLSALKLVGGTVLVQFNAMLDHLSLSVLESTSGLHVFDNTSLRVIDMPVIEEIGGRGMRLRVNAGLTSASLPLVTSVSGAVEIVDNPSLRSLSMPLLLSFGTRTDFIDNPSLDTLQLGALFTVGGRFHIADMDSLDDFSGLGKLLVVSGPLDIRDNDQLSDFRGLERLTTIGGSTSIVGNPALTTLGHLSSMSDITGNLTITDNASLPTSDASAFAGAVTVFGATSISGNRP